MSSAVAVDIFVEDRAHEEFLVPLLRRVAKEEAIRISPPTRCVSDHARRLRELLHSGRLRFAQGVV